MKVKKCSKCKQEKPLLDFAKDKHAKDGLCFRCKDCQKADYMERREAKLAKQKEYRTENREVILHKERERHQRNKDKINSRKRQQYHANPEPKLMKGREYYRENKDALRPTRRKWEQNNKDIRYPKRNKRTKERYDNDVVFRLGLILRSRLNSIIRGKVKAGSAVKDLGCSLKQFKQYIEAQFQPGMSWENYGKEGWHIDHIVPLSRFDLMDRDQFLKACHYTNLQPLWAEDNIRKGASLPEEKYDR